MGIRRRPSKHTRMSRAVLALVVALACVLTVIATEADGMSSDVDVLPNRLVARDVRDAANKKNQKKNSPKKKRGKGLQKRKSQKKKSISKRRKQKKNRKLRFNGKQKATREQK